MSLTMRFGTILGPSVSVARKTRPPRLAFERILGRCAGLAAGLPRGTIVLHRLHDLLHQLLRVRQQPGRTGSGPAGARTHRALRVSG